MTIFNFIFLDTKVFIKIIFIDTSDVTNYAKFGNLVTNTLLKNGQKRFSNMGGAKKKKSLLFKVVKKSRRDLQFLKTLLAESYALSKFRFRRENTFSDFFRRWDFCRRMVFYCEKMNTERFLSEGYPRTVWMW